MGYAMEMLRMTATRAGLGEVLVWRDLRYDGPVDAFVK